MANVGNEFCSRVSQAESEIKAEKRRRGWIIRKAETQWRGNTSPKTASSCLLPPAPRTRFQYPSPFQWKLTPIRTARSNDAKKPRRKKRNESQSQPARRGTTPKRSGNSVGKKRPRRWPT